jgi:hypothetical protein
MGITYRSIKGVALTSDEVDENFRFLYEDIIGTDFILIKSQGAIGHTFKFTCDDNGMISLPGEDIGLTDAATEIIIRSKGAAGHRWSFTCDDNGMISLPGTDIGL